MLRALVLAGLLVARVAAADQAATGAVVAPAPSSNPLHLGGDEPRFVLYLRDGPRGDAERVALETALAALARVPGAGVDLYFDPSDREAPAMAEAFLTLPDEPSRRALLFALYDRGRPRPIEPTGVARIGRSMGLSLPLLLGRNPAARALLRRPPGVTFADRSFCALEGRVLVPADLDTLLAAEAWPTPSEPTLTDRPLAVGDPLAHYTISLRFTLPLSVAARDNLRAALEAYDQARARLHLELALSADEPVSEGAVVLYRAFHRATPTERVALARAIVDGAQPQNEATAVWVVQGAGVDPEPLLALPDAAPPRVAGLPSISVAVDGEPGTASLHGQLTPSLRRRLERSSR